MAYQKLNWLNKGETGAIPINKTNLNHMDDGIERNSNEIANIIESGSNANGEYIKFANGTMICKNTQRIVGITTSASSSSVVPKSDEQTGFTFPIEFIDRPIVLMNACRTSAWIGYSWIATTSTTQNYCIYTPAPVSDFYIDIQYVAFGRWK